MMKNCTNFVENLTAIFNFSIRNNISCLIKEEPTLKKVHDLLFIILLVLVMFSMGCSVAFEEVSFLFASQISFQTQ